MYTTDNRSYKVPEDGDSLEISLTYLQESLEDIDSDVNLVQGAIGTIQQDISGLQGDISLVQGAIGTIQQDIGGLQGDISLVQSAIGTLQGDVEIILATPPDPGGKLYLYSNSYGSL